MDFSLKFRGIIIFDTMKKIFKPAAVLAKTSVNGPMNWSCAPNQSVATAQRFCKI